MNCCGVFGVRKDCWSYGNSVATYYRMMFAAQVRYRPQIKLTPFIQSHFEIGLFNLISSRFDFT